MAGSYRSGGSDGRFNNEYNQSPQPERTRGCKELVQEARSKDHWLYDPVSKTWYSPEEFWEKFGRIVTGNEKFLALVQVRSPDDGINAGFQCLTDVQIKLADLMVRVMSYYRKKK